VDGVDVVERFADTISLAKLERGVAGWGLGLQ